MKKNGHMLKESGNQFTSMLCHNLFPCQLEFVPIDPASIQYYWIFISDNSLCILWLDVTPLLFLLFLYVYRVWCVNRYTRKQLPHRNGIFSSLGQHFPFIFNIFKKQHQQMDNFENANLSKTPHASNVVNAPVTVDMPEANSLDGTAEVSGSYSGKIPKLSDEEFCSSRFFHAYLISV